MAIVASTHVLLAGTLWLTVPFLARVTEPASVSGMEEVAETTVVPVVAEVMTTVQLAVAPAPVYLHVGLPTFPTRRSSDLAVAVPLPNVVFTAVTVMVSV